jgi:hypothetical protein
MAILSAAKGLVIFQNAGFRGGRVLSFERTRKMTEIYALYSTQDGRVRYVGQSGDSALRFKEHQRGSLFTWFHRQWRQGYLVRRALLEVCDYDDRHSVEQKWIRRFPPSDLLNRRKLRPWWLPPVGKPPVVPEIVSYMRRHISNVDGFRGVQCDCQTDYYRVLVYNGRWVEWLKTGDELPGGSEPIWFSDLAQAVNARDKIHRALRGPASWHRTKLPLLRISLLMNARRQEDVIASAAWEQERYQKEGYVW